MWMFVDTIRSEEANRAPAYKRAGDARRLA